MITGDIDQNDERCSFAIEVKRGRIASVFLCRHRRTFETKKIRFLSSVKRLAKKSLVDGWSMAKISKANPLQDIAEKNKSMCVSWLCWKLMWSCLDQDSSLDKTHVTTKLSWKATKRNTRRHSSSIVALFVFVFCLSSFLSLSLQFDIRPPFSFLLFFFVVFSFVSASKMAVVLPKNDLHVWKNMLTGRGGTERKSKHRTALVTVHSMIYHHLDSYTRTPVDTSAASTSSSPRIHRVSSANFSLW